MALDHRDIFEPASIEEGNAIVPYDEFDSRKLLGLAAFIILHIRPDAAHTAAVVARFTGCKQTEHVIKHVVRLCWYLADSEHEAVLTYNRGVGDPKTRRRHPWFQDPFVFPRHFLVGTDKQVWFISVLFGFCFLVH